MAEAGACGCNQRLPIYISKWSIFATDQVEIFVVLPMRSQGRLAGQHSRVPLKFEVKTWLRQKCNGLVVSHRFYYTKKESSVLESEKIS